METNSETLKPNSNLTKEEGDFSVEEMFISSTDLKGIITSGNDVFVRVSGYSKEKLIGAPHNIIRHPDIPKVVFKLLWDTIEAGKPISAYVKNRSINGKPYWVFASVIPAQNGYLSVRIKPTSALFELIPSIYAKMKEREMAKGMEAAGELLFETLASLGIKSYEEFMGKALYEELRSRDLKMADQKLKDKFNIKTYTGSREWIGTMESISKLSSQSFASIFEKLNTLSNVGTIHKHATQIQVTCERLDHVGLNMSVVANKLGKEGPSLATVSAAFQKTSHEISGRLSQFTTSLTEVLALLEKLKLYASLGRVYLEMLTFFTHEILNSENFEKEKIHNMTDLHHVITTVQKLFSQISELQAESYQKLKEFRTQTNVAKSIVLSLDLIRMGGRLEGSRTQKTDEAFTPYISEMVTCITSIETPIQEIHLVSEQLITAMAEIRTELANLESQLTEMDMLRYRDYQFMASQAKSENHEQN